MQSRAVRVLLLACAAWLSGCQPKRDPNVLLLVIDALRPDHLGCYGYALDTSPTIDALARRGVLFADATSLSSYTRAAVPSILASVHPGAHGVLSLLREMSFNASSCHHEVGQVVIEPRREAVGYMGLVQLVNDDSEMVREFGHGGRSRVYISYKLA